MRTDRDGGTGPIRDVCVAVLCCATEHVAETWCLIGWPGLSCHRVFEPLHPQLIDAHWGGADPVLVARHADPSVRAFAKDTGDVSMMVHLCHGGISGNLRRARAHRPRDFYRADDILVRLARGITGRFCGDGRVAITA